jgi:hypothetical protein
VSFFVGRVTAAGTAVFGAGLAVAGGAEGVLAAGEAGPAPRDGALGPEHAPHARRTTRMLGFRFMVKSW